MRMDTAACIPYLERIPKQGGARRLFKIDLRPAEKDAIGVWRGCGWLWVRKNKHMRRFNTLFLYARWGDVDFVPGGY